MTKWSHFIGIILNFLYVCLILRIFWKRLFQEVNEYVSLGLVTTIDLSVSRVRFARKALSMRSCFAQFHPKYNAFKGVSKQLCVYHLYRNVFLAQTRIRSPFFPRLRKAFLTHYEPPWQNVSIVSQIWLILVSNCLKRSQICLKYVSDKMSQFGLNLRPFWHLRYNWDCPYLRAIWEQFETFFCVVKKVSKRSQKCLKKGLGGI